MANITVQERIKQIANRCPGKCFSCGEAIVGRPRYTEKGEMICTDCNDYYAFGGPGEDDV